MTNKDEAFNFKVMKTEIADLRNGKLGGSHPTTLLLEDLDYFQRIYGGNRPFYGFKPHYQVDF
jgi:hypothetical protein